MIKLTKNIFLWILIVTISGILYTVLAQNIQQGTISMGIKGLGIRHGTPENFPIATVMSSPNDQEISGQFLEYFWIEDIEGYKTGHYTTIQCDGIYGPSNTRLTGIELKAGSTTPELLMGATGPNVKINTGLANYTNIIEPVTYIYKETNTNHIGIVNKYGDKPWIKILIPAGTPPGTYSGTIVFSFYMND